MEALILGEIADEARLPKGVLSIVTGDVETGKLLTTDPRVDLVHFTGSDKVGAMIQAQAAPTLKRIVMELGGKSALIVRADADIQTAARSEEHTSELQSLMRISYALFCLTTNSSHTTISHDILSLI